MGGGGGLVRNQSPEVSSPETGLPDECMHTFLDVSDFKELLNTASGRTKKRSVFNERTEKASASQYFQVRIITWLICYHSKTWRLLDSTSEYVSFDVRIMRQ